MRFQIGFTAERIRIFSTVNKLKIAALTSRMASKIVFLFQTKPINLTIVICRFTGLRGLPVLRDVVPQNKGFSDDFFRCFNLYKFI